jgi:hypothetical protein
VKIGLRLSLLVLVLCLGMLPAANAGAASIWTPVASGTAQGITAIASSQPGQVVYATGGGEIHYLTPGGFAAAKVLPTTTTPFPFTDVAMSPNGTIGIAVGLGGEIYRSTNSGAEWNLLTPPPTRTECGGASKGVDEELTSVHFADANTIYITGANKTVLKSVSAGTSFTEANKTISGCVASETFGDTFWTSATSGFLLGNNFGTSYRSNDGLANTPGGTVKLTDLGVNGFGGGNRLAVDTANPQRMWAIHPSAGPTYFQYSVNGGAEWQPTTLIDNAMVTFKDLAAGVGTNVVAVGGNGAIYTSLDGSTFVAQPAPAPIDTAAWESVAFEPGTATAWVGGAGGTLVRTTVANTLPAPPPAVTPPVTPAPPAPVAPIAAKAKPAVCKVPNLKGKSLKAAKRRLAKAHCKLGRVTKEKGVTAKDGKVTKQSPKAGAKRAAKAKVAVTLGAE